ncbi:CoA transferase [Promicromonospora sukumoe]|uniref:CoA transferase n=1 Tax=Promicromonospora sukumoe TaxID=88382 RepID=UPI0037CAF168
MEPWLAAHLPVLDLALDAVRAVQRAAARARRGAGSPGSGGSDAAVPGGPPDPARVAVGFASDRVLALDGRPVQGFAELSGFFRTADGWVRTHANYPHHRGRLTALVDLPDDVGRPAFAERLTTLPAQELEDGAADAGAIVARVRTEREWRGSPPGRAAASGPLVRTEVRGAEARTGSHTGERSGATGAAPLAGVRVLDLTRVIAGPVATRTLALLGADVLRVDPPVPAEIGWQHLDTGQGKRSTVLDLRDARDHRTAQDLLDGADVLVTGYRPGAVEALGLRVPPGTVTGRVSAWGDTGPWAARRGFDSIVQAACGIALLEGRDGAPGALPAQALDHASGYLLAAGVVDALTLRDGDGLGRDVAVSLARTAAWLLDLPGRDPHHPAAARPPDGATVTHGSVTTARPVLPGYDDYPRPAHPWGTDAPGWLPAGRGTAGRGTAGRD